MAYASKKRTRDGDIPFGSNLFGVCRTESSVINKIVALSDFNVLTSGVTIHVYFAYANTAENPKLQVGSTSLVPVKRNGNTQGKWSDGSVISFTYDGTNWIQNDSDDDGETYTLSVNGKTLTLTGSNGSTSSVTLPDDDTTYSLSLNGHTLTLTPSNGSAQSVALPNDSISYSAGNGLADSSNTFTLAYSVGDIIITDTNVNPSTLYGGTWELIDKQFKYRVSTDALFEELDLASIGTQRFVWEGHHVNVRLTNCKTNQVIADNQLVLFGGYASALGMTSMFNQYFMGYGDEANGIIMMEGYNTSGYLNFGCGDVVTHNSPNTIPASVNLQFTFDIYTSKEAMIDSFCNFYWKKTA